LIFFSISQEFDSKSEMQRHAKERHRADEKSHKCSICLKSFPTTQQLMQHNLVHNNVRKYSCHYCDKTFKQLSHVQQHQRIHTGSAQMIQLYCDNFFTQPDK
jgi:zinc finger protein 362/384